MRLKALGLQKAQRSFSISPYLFIYHLYGEKHEKHTLPSLSELNRGNLKHLRTITDLQCYATSGSLLHLLRT
jgi:hypothetical protein